MLQAGFHRAGLDRYTGFKSSPYTEGALFYGERLADRRGQVRPDSLLDRLEEPKRVECPPGGSG